MKFFPRIWNAPGSGGGSGPDPWRRKKPNGPPDLDQMLSALIKKLRVFWGQGTQPSSNKPWDNFWGSLLGAVLFLYLVSGIYIVNPPERAVVTRLGRYVRTEGPGPHWLPPLIESK